jgi:hypothetical protein
MKRVLLYIGFVVLTIGFSCTKSTIHTGKVLANSCTAQPGYMGAIVQLDTSDQLSFDWKNPADGIVYSNVIATYDSVLSRSVGKSFTYASVRKPRPDDVVPVAILAICLTYQAVYLNNIVIK